MAYRSLLLCNNRFNGSQQRSNSQSLKIQRSSISEYRVVKHDQILTYFKCSVDKFDAQVWTVCRRVFWWTCQWWGLSPWLLRKIGDNWWRAGSYWSGESHRKEIVSGTLTKMPSLLQVFFIISELLQQLYHVFCKLYCLSFKVLDKH